VLSAVDKQTGELMNDLKFALRQLTKSPGFTATAVLIVAIGIGAATAMFSAVDALVLRPLALPEPERLFVVYESNLPRNVPFFSSSLPNYVDWRNRGESWESLAAVRGRAMNLTGGSDPEFINVRAMTANFLPTLGITPLMGRGFLEDEDRPGGNHVAIITHDFWQRRFGGDPQVIGRNLTLDGSTYTIVGVTGPKAFFPGGIEIGIPLGADPLTERRMNHELDVFGRLKRGATLEQADAELKSIAAGIWAEHPELDRGWSTVAVPLARDLFSADLRTGLFMLLGAVGLLLLIACANFSNLLLVRGSARAHELAIRAALGAGRVRVIRQLLTESVLISAIGGGLGMLFSTWAVNALRSTALPRAAEISVDGRVLAVACAATLLTGLLAGFAPALKMSLSLPREALKNRSSIQGHRSGWRDSMVVAQLAVSLTLLIGAALLLNSFWRLHKVHPGFATDRVLTMSLRPADNERAVPFYEQVAARIVSLPEVAAVGFISNLPLTEGNTSNNVFPVGPSALPVGESVQSSWRLVDGGYFDAMQIPVLRGRTFAGLTPELARQSVILSASLAKMLFGDEDPLGRETERGGKGGAKLTVIGVVGDIRGERLNTKSAPAFYMSMHRFLYGPMRLVVRTTGGTAPLAAAIRGVVKEVGSSVPMFQIQSMEEIRSGSLNRERFLTGLLSGFGGTALFLAVLGTYGVIAFNVQQRRREIGIRIAVGAQKGDIIRLVLGHGARLMAPGIVLGLIGGLAAAQLFSKLLFETDTTNPLIYAAAVLVLSIAALAASLVPARQAATVEPMAALKLE
jgi:putative ABC transport system permease protein